jgi:hypothetical protein
MPPLSRGSITPAHAKCASLLAAALLTIFGTGCEITPTTQAMICVQNEATGEPIPNAQIQLREMAMLKPWRAQGEGTTGEDGCTLIRAGLLPYLTLFIDTPGGAHYRGSLAHPRIDPSKATTALPSMYGADGPYLKIVLTEVK